MTAKLKQFNTLLGIWIKTIYIKRGLELVSEFYHMKLKTSKTLCFQGTRQDWLLYFGPLGTLALLASFNAMIQIKELYGGFLS